MEVSDQSVSDGGEVGEGGDLVQEAYIYLTEHRYPPGCADSRKFIQILHDGGGHWIMISTIGTKHPEVRMYDSLYCSLSSALKRQIAALLATKEKKISVHFMQGRTQRLKKGGAGTQT